MFALMQFLLAFSAFGLLWAAFAWLFLSICVAIVADEKGRSGFGFFLMAFVFSPIIGVLFLIASPDRAREKREAEARARDAEAFKASIKSLWQQLAEAARQGPTAATSALPPPFAGQDLPGVSRVPSPPSGPALMAKQL